MRQIQKWWQMPQSILIMKSPSRLFFFYVFVIHLLVYKDFNFSSILKTGRTWVKTNYPRLPSCHPFFYSAISGKVATSGFATWRLRRWWWLPGWWWWCRLSEPNGFPYGWVKFYFPPFPFLHFWWVIVVGCINVWVLLQSETMIT